MSLSELVGTLPERGSGPLYLQLQHLLRDAIGAQLLKPEQALPSERDLCEDFDLSRVTIRKAIEGLVDEGLLVRKRGAGTFIADMRREARDTRVEKIFSKLSSFSEDMESRGMKPSSRWLSQSTGMVSPDEAMALALSPGTAVHRFRRLRFADGKPMALEYTILPAHYLPDITAVTHSLYEALAQTGSRPTRALQRLRAVGFDAEQAEAIGVEIGHPGLLIERRGFLPDGRPVEFTQSYYRGDAYDFVAELSGIDDG
ncbi:GntR family transcriptional regulator [Sphingomonas oryzagri]|uniref:GntR family transcriptional regulator n=1 Tax=Sphingomonas oryzagri TaxID=3042314 RepID=A0ABT6MZ50_9SPHN|nr:GntR family transcriptional regulator [Sphingomonas oryzagri]MDH7637773.1 GntR family transcriptional regulator [Sphingomonas oryzagri]